MTWLDHLFALTLVLGLPAYAAWGAPRLVRRIESGVAHARTSEYLWTTVMQWALALALIAGWWRASRSFGALGMVWPAGGALWWTLAVSIAAIAFFAWQAYAVATRPDAQASVRQQLATRPAVRVLIPTTTRESRQFGLLAVTAGICEEMLYRGYLLWYLDQMLPGSVAIAAAIVVFGLAHAYQGAQGVVLTGAAGAVAMGLYLLTGSLLAPIVIHATVDLANGLMASHALRGPHGGVRS